MKPIKGLKTAHTANSQRGMGDSYGSGVKNPMGKMRESMIDSVPKVKKMARPPNSVA